jgi:hypothetical protein
MYTALAITRTAAPEPISDLRIGFTCHLDEDGHRSRFRAGGASASLAEACSEPASGGGRSQN